MKVQSPFRTRYFAAAALSLVATALIVTPAGAGLTTEASDVRGQGPAGSVVSAGGAVLQRSDSGLSAKLTMPTPEPGTYNYPPAQSAPFPFPAAVQGHPEAYSLWVFVFNYPDLCSQPCDSNDLGVTAPARGGAFNAAGHVVGGSTLQLDGHVSMNSTPFGGSMLLEPLTAVVHFAVAPHGALNPALLPDQITKPIGNPSFWWIAIFD
jgi:hypothetical protein